MTSSTHFAGAKQNSSQCHSFNALEVLKEGAPSATKKIKSKQNRVKVYFQILKKSYGYSQNVTVLSCMATLKISTVSFSEYIV